MCNVNLFSWFDGAADVMFAECNAADLISCCLFHDSTLNVMHYAVYGLRRAHMKYIYYDYDDDDYYY